AVTVVALILACRVLDRPCSKPCRSCRGCFKVFPRPLISCILVFHDCSDGLLCSMQLKLKLEQEQVLADKGQSHFQSIVPCMPMLSCRTCLVSLRQFTGCYITVAYPAGDCAQKGSKSITKEHHCSSKVVAA
ncbi:unnamed protein product, partial [Polarella glacialis]